MAMGRPKSTLVLDSELREQLESLATHVLFRPAWCVEPRLSCLSASGKNDERLPRNWRRAEHGRPVATTVPGTGGVGTLRRVTPRPPRPNQRRASCPISSQDAEDETQSSNALEYRQIADETGVSKSTVHRIWQAFGLQPHRQKYFKLSSDPFFVGKSTGYCRAVSKSPENAVVLCVDEKSGIQALERTQPMLPLGLGYVEGVTHDYRRHGTTTLFAALDTGERQSAHEMSIASPASGISEFSPEIEKNVPKNLEVHIIVDNYATHKHLRVRRWFATRPRFHVHFTPTYASWLNQVEIWFNRITQRALRRGTFSSVKELVEKIDHYVQNSNRMRSHSSGLPQRFDLR